MKQFIILSCLLMSAALGFSSCNEKEEVNPEQKTPSTFIPGSIALEDGCEGGEDEEPLPMLAGSVKNSSNVVLPRACVELRTSTHTFLGITGADSSGHYFFNSLSNGSYYLVVSKTGYATQQVNFTVSGGSAQVLNVVLQ